MSKSSEPKYWTAENIAEPFLFDGDEIEFEERRWIVASWRIIMGRQRQSDTAMYVRVALLSVDQDSIGDRDIKPFDLYARWYVKDLPADNRPPEFIYTIIQKKAWRMIWVRTEML